MKFRGILCPVVILTIILLSIASCNFGEAPDITVQDAMVIPSPMFIGTASAFMLITNDGKGSDVLIGCSIKEFPAVNALWTA
jgi:copper(I)-binding protein